MYVTRIINFFLTHIDPHFSTSHFYFFTAGILNLAISVFFFQKNKITYSLFFLFLSGFLLSYFVGTLDNFLCICDEQYHALVAKNMIENPFKPMLFKNPLLEYDYKNWTVNHIWLHKQPLFLWQIALSIKLFGLNEIAVRLPSFIMRSLFPIFVFRIGFISLNKNVGYIAAVLASTNHFLFELSAGKFSTDHNDIAFMFYVTLSFWSLYEYYYSKRKFWIYLIGFFSGCALLTKWLIGLIVYLAWFMVLVFESKKNTYTDIKRWYPFLKSLGITFLIFLPWQIFIFTKYTREAIYETFHASRHFTEVVEGHAGNWWYHFDAIKDIYGSGDIIPYSLLLGFIAYIYNTKREHKIIALTSVGFVYVFFSIAATKMKAFTIIVSFFGFIFWGTLLSYFFEKISQLIKNSKLFQILFFLILIYISILSINLKNIAMYHFYWSNGYEKKQMECISKLNEMRLPLKTVVFNSDMSQNGHISVMFYTSYISYGFIPNKDQISMIKQQNYKIVVIQKDSLPDYILKDNDILKIPCSPK